MNDKTEMRHGNLPPSTYVRSPRPGSGQNDDSPRQTVYSKPDQITDRSNEVVHLLHSFHHAKMAFGMSMRGLLRWMVAEELIAKRLELDFGVDIKELVRGLDDEDQRNPDSIKAGTTSVAVHRISYAATGLWMNDSDGRPNPVRPAEAWIRALLMESVPNVTTNILLQAKLHPRFLDPKPPSPHIRPPYVDDVIDNLFCIAVNSKSEMMRGLAESIQALLLDPESDSRKQELRKTIHDCLVVQ